MAERADTRGIPGAPREGHRAGLHRRVRPGLRAGHLPLRRLRDHPVRIRREVRLRLRLAGVLRTGRRERRRGGERPDPRDDPHRGPLRELWRAPRPCIPGRPPAHRAALLHQLGGAEAPGTLNHLSEAAPTADTGGMRRPLGLIVPVLILCAGLPVASLIVFGDRMVMPPLWVHFYGVGVSALVATAAAAALTIAGAKSGDVRTVVVGGGFSLMAALLAVHGLTTPGVLIGNNGLIAVSGAATLPVGGCVMALSALPQFGSARAIPRVLGVQITLACAIVVFSLVGALDPMVVPGVPAPRSTAALLLFALGLAVYGALAIRATNTFLLTRRAADLAVVLGISLLACSLYGALMLDFMYLGWWLGHIFEFAGLLVVGASLVYDLRRGRRSRTPVGDLRAAGLVASEGAFLGARVRALTVRLAAKDASTEEHTRRVAMLAVEIGGQLGLSPTRLRSLAIGGLLHHIGKLSGPDSVLPKPGPPDDDEFCVVQLHPARR